MEISLEQGTESFSLYVQLFDNTNGAPKTGLAYDDASLVTSYAADKGSIVDVSPVSIGVVTVYTSGGFVEVDASALPGVYRFDVPDLALTSGNIVTVYFIHDDIRSKAVVIMLSPLEAKVDILDTNVAAVLADTDFLQKIADGDLSIDTGQTPWQMVIKEKSTAYELIRKDVKTPAGVDITDVASIIGQILEP